jgi:catechol 2,3-dioxygenase-like lactoylglutathione lyase family enzyme
MSEIKANSFDHVALWVDERDPLSDFLVDHLGMHVIEKADDFTLLGVDAKRGKLTLFDAEGPREAGALERVVLRVTDVNDALAAMPDGFAVEKAGEVAQFEAPGGLSMGLIEAEGLDYDLDHVVLRVPDPEAAASGFAELGFERVNGSLQVADKSVQLEPGGEPEGERPLLNHLALLVDSAEAAKEEAERRGLEIEKVVDAENTLATFVRGPDGITVEYVEHKPGFSLE